MDREERKPKLGLGKRPYRDGLGHLRYAKDGPISFVNWFLSKARRIHGNGEREAAENTVAK